MSLRELVPILQIAIGPVILISGIGLLLLSMTNRFGRVIDRSRQFSLALKSMKGAERDVAISQIKILSTRALLVRQAITFATVSLLFAAILVITLFLAAALRWIAEFRVDALRLDAIHAIVDLSARTFLEELRDAVSAKARELGRKVCLFPESNRNDSRVVSAAEAGGLGFDAVWNDDFHHSLHVLLTGERKGYYEDYAGIEDLAGCYREGFLYAGRFSKFRGMRYGRSSKDIPTERFIVYAQNHDQIGNRRTGDRLSQSLALDQLKLAAGTVLLSPFVPLLFMGEEYAEPAPFQYFVSHGDPALIEAVRRGRKEEFANFDWTGNVPDPQGESTFLGSKLNWDLHNEGRHRILWDFYKELLRLRRELPALARLDNKSLETTSLAPQRVLLIRRWHSSSQVLIICHFESAAIELSLPMPSGRWRKTLDSGETTHGRGSNRTAEIIEAHCETFLSLGPWAFLVLVQDPATQK
jgi:maltooligosyltrehalose trehalohydrolase